jgi:peptidoglycan/xylan/chitin deacetylase (PgdA/CDA1 family)
MGMTHARKRIVRRAVARIVSQIALRLGIITHLRAARRLLRRYRVVILTYHRVDDVDEGLGMTVTPERFGQHLDYLRRHYRVVCLDEAVRRLGSPEGLRSDLAVITFDDGYRDNFLAAHPRLRERGLPASIFVTTGFIDGSETPWFLSARSIVSALRTGVSALRTRRPRLRLDANGSSELVRLALRPDLAEAEAAIEIVERLKTVDAATQRRALRTLASAARETTSRTPPVPFLTWDDLALLERAGVSIGSHTVSHPLLSRIARADACREIEESHAVLERHLGRRPTTFAYPNGHPPDFTDEDVDCVRRAGYVAACTTTAGFNYPGADPFRLKRMGIGNDTVAHFAAKIEGLLLPAYGRRQPAFREALR